MKIQNKKKIALVLSGGGVKAAAFHVGVCLALEDLGFCLHHKKDPQNEQQMDIDMYVGASAGAFIIALLASGYEVRTIIDAFLAGSDFPEGTKIKRHAKGSKIKPISYLDLFAINGLNILKSIPNLIKGNKHIIISGLESVLRAGIKIDGLFTTRGIEKYLSKILKTKDCFKYCQKDIFIPATYLNYSKNIIFSNKKGSQNGKNVYASHVKISQAVAASAALPPIYAPYPVKNLDGEEEFFFDGGIRDNLPIKIASDNGADLIISSYSMQPYHYHESKGSLHHQGIPAVINQAIYQSIERKVEKYIEHQEDLKNIYNSIEKYLQSENIDKKHRENLLNIVETHSSINPKTSFIYIHPSPEDLSMFFSDHFSLNPKVLFSLLKIGFHSAHVSMKKYLHMFHKSTGF